MMDLEMDFNTKLLIKKLKSNKKKHIKEFKEAIAGFKVTYQEELDKMRDYIINTLTPSLDKCPMAIYLQIPQSHEKDYDTVIEMLEYSSSEQVVLNADQFKEYVLDQWGWSGQHHASNTLYAGKGGSIGDVVKARKEVTTEDRRNRIIDKIDDWVNYNENKGDYQYSYTTGTHKAGTYKQVNVQGWGRRHRLSVTNGGKRYISISVGKGLLKFEKGEKGTAIILPDVSWEAEKEALEYLKGCIGDGDFDSAIDKLAKEAGKHLAAYRSG